MNLTLIVIAAVAATVLLLLLTGVRLVNEFERGVVFRFGRYQRVAAPGLRLVAPLGIDRMVKVDVRTLTVEVPTQEAITSDNVLARVLAAVYFQVVNPQLAVTKVVNFREATAHLVQSTLRSVIGQVTLNDLLTQRQHINETLRNIIDEETEPWGITVTLVELKDIVLPEAMQRALGRQAEAEREKTAKIITAEGELVAARALSDAASVIAETPSGLQLRYLQAVTEIGGDKNTIVVFPVPIELMRPLFEMQSKVAKTAAPDGEPASPVEKVPGPGTAPAFNGGAPSPGGLEPGGAVAPDATAAPGAGGPAAPIPPPPPPPPPPLY